VLEARHRILPQRSSPLLDAIKPHNDRRFKSFYTGSTPQFSGRALTFDARRQRIMQWRARGVAAVPRHGPLQLLVRRWHDASFLVS
jgi:hypothetical protein